MAKDSSSIRAGSLVSSIPLHKESKPIIVPAVKESDGTSASPKASPSKLDFMRKHIPEGRDLS